MKFEKDLIGEWEEPYVGYLNDCTALQLSLNEIPIRDFLEEVEEVTAFKYSLDNYPEEAVADLSILYASIQGYMSRITHIITLMYSQKSNLNDVYRESKRIYKKAKNRILVSNLKVKNMSNQALRDAYVDDYLVDLVDIKDSLENKIENVEDLISIMTVHDKNLERANTNVSRQQRIIETLISLQYPIQTAHRKKQRVL